MRLTVLLFLLFAGCGYHFSGGSLPEGIRLLNLPLAVNKTSEPLLENVLAAPLTAVLARQKAIELVESEAGSEAVLQATITDYHADPTSYDSNDRISVYTATIVVHFSLKRQKDGKIIWQGELQRQETYVAAIDKNQQEDLESIVIESMVNNIADDLLYRLITRF